MGKYKILCHEVTGVKGTRYKRGQIVDAENLISEGIPTLISTKAITPYIEVEKPKVEPGEQNTTTGAGANEPLKPETYKGWKMDQLEAELKLRGIDSKGCKNNGERIALLIKNDAEQKH